MSLGISNSLSLVINYNHWEIIVRVVNPKQDAQVPGQDRVLMMERCAVSTA